jgi:hypothetical protein
MFSRRGTRSQWAIRAKVEKEVGGMAAVSFQLQQILLIAVA